MSAHGSHSPAWRWRGDFHFGSLTILDWTCIVVIAGCVQTMAVRLQRIMVALRAKIRQPLMSPHDRASRSDFPALTSGSSSSRWSRRNCARFLQLGSEETTSARSGAPIARGSSWRRSAWRWFSPDAFHIIGVTLLAIFGFKEFARASGLYRDWWMTGAVYAGIVTVGVASLMPHPRGEEPGTGWYGFFVAVPVFAIALILLIPILRNRARGELQRMSLAIVGFVYIGWMFGHLGFLANAANAYGYLLYVIFATELNDVAAFTFGRLFGRHPLPQRNQPEENLGRRARRAGRLDGLAVVASFFVSANSARGS